MIFALILGCGSSGPLADALAPYGLTRAQQDALPDGAVIVALHADRAVVIPREGSPSTHTLDPREPELAAALWSVVVGPGSGPWVLAITPDADPRTAADAMVAAESLGFEPRFVVRARP